MGMKAGRRERKRKGNRGRRWGVGRRGQLSLLESRRSTLLSQLLLGLLAPRTASHLSSSLSPFHYIPAPLSPPAFLLRTTALLCFFPLEMGFPIPAASISSLTLPLKKKNKKQKTKLFRIVFVAVVFFWLCWVLAAVRGLSLVESGWPCACSSLRWLVWLRSTGSRARRLQ